MKTKWMELGIENVTQTKPNGGWKGESDVTKALSSVPQTLPKRFQVTCITIHVNFVLC